MVLVKKKNEPKVLRTLDQVGKTDALKDMKLKALMPGKRISKNNKIYWETRKNRSDKKNKKI